ncbi:hypothetical protein GYA13_01645 [Candidatus Kuenenbacteria bacterium]|nr:hypothetical protein [Candidatus Kuenenbacteria bacterium]
MGNKIKFLVLLAIIAGLCAQVPTTKAAFDDAVLENEAVLYISGVAPTTGGTAGIYLTMGGETKVESIEVTSTGLTVAMPAGSKIHLVSPDRKTFINSLTGTHCETGRSYLMYTAMADQTLTITFADGDNCAADISGTSAPTLGSVAEPKAEDKMDTDKTAPSANDILVLAKDTEAKIDWQTNEPSISWVVYGTSTAYGFEEKIAVHKTDHSLTLSNLMPLTTYYYQIKTQDASGNEGVSAGQSFKTVAVGTVVETPTLVATPDEKKDSPAVSAPQDNLGKGIAPDMKLAKRLAGRLLLRVERGGEIWYVDTKEYKRYQVTFANALYVFQKLSWGINNANLARIPVSGSQTVGDANLRNKMKGKLLLAVEDHGRIWYVDKDGYRHEATWKNLMDLFRELSLGITDANLAKIPAGSL